jgi:hypothetical protein
MLELLLTALAVTATWRVAAMVARERGPADAFVELRSWVHEQYGERSWQGEGISCPLNPWLWPLGWLGIAGAAALLFIWEPR